MTTNKLRNDLATTDKGKEHFWIKISSQHGATTQISRVDDLKSGAAVTRSLDEIIQFDMDMRKEIFGSLSVQPVDDNGTILPPFHPNPNATFVQKYVESILRIHRAVHSASLVSLLKNEGADNKDQDSYDQLMYIQYLLPGSQDAPPFQEIPKLRALNKTITNICSGWWVVWWFRLEYFPLSNSFPNRSNNQVEFKLFIKSPHTDEAMEVNAENNSYISSPDLVHQQTCLISQSAIYHGSYRLPSESVGVFTASLEFSNTDALSSLIGSTHVTLECASISHDVFKAACEAARDQNESERRRRLAPMLAKIWDCNESIFVEVYPWKVMKNEEAIKDNEHNMMNYHQKEGKIGVSVTAEKLENLQRERNVLREELTKANRNTSELNRQLRLSESERRVWQVAKEEVCCEISRLIESIAKEKDEKKEVLYRLNVAENEINELREQLKSYEFQVPTDDIIAEKSEAPSCVETKATEMIGRLQELTSELQATKTDNEKLRLLLELCNARIQSERKRSEETVNEVREREQVLQIEVLRLEQELQKRKLSKKEFNMSNHRANRDHVHTRRYLDSFIMAFQHPDARLNRQLTSLRYRHEQLSALLIQNPNDLQNLEILGKIEKIIHDIVASAKTKPTL